MLAHASISLCNIHCKLVSDKTFTPSLNLPPSFTSSSPSLSLFPPIHTFLASLACQLPSFLPSNLPWNHLQNYAELVTRVQQTLSINFVYKKKEATFFSSTSPSNSNLFTLFVSSSPRLCTDAVEEGCVAIMRTYFGPSSSPCARNHEFPEIGAPFSSLIEPAEEAARRVIAERVVTEFAYKWHREMESRGREGRRGDKSTSWEFIG